MNLFKEILISLLLNEQIIVTFPNLKLSASEMVELEAFHALAQIKAVIDDDSLSDFDAIEKIVCIFEQIGSNGGHRHDF